jgi:DNA invertase Pin-like site-specific DNA recombinase
MDSGDVPFVAVDNPHANRFTLHILAAVAEHEAMQISKRTKDALEAARKRGKRLGGWRAIREGVEPLTCSRVARRLRHGEPSRRNGRRVASTRTVALRGLASDTQQPSSSRLRMKRRRKDAGPNN